MTIAPNRTDHSSERGAAAMMAVFILGTAFALFIIALGLIQTSKQLIGKQLIFQGQSFNAAHAGLIDGLAWFRRQTTQPVLAFDPHRDLSAVPPINETDDESTGIVREFEVSQQGGVWGRYEVRRTAIQDVSTLRGKGAPGTVWKLQSEGIVYVRRDPTKAFDVSPNQVIGRQTMRTEIQRLTLVLPGKAAICGANGAQTRSQTNTRINGDKDIGVIYAAGTGTPSLSGKVYGTPTPTSTASPFNADIESVFGVTQQELVNMADLVVTSVNDLPATLPDMYLVCIKGNATFDSTRPLRGTGILVVFGNLTIAANSYSSYNGLIYVTGSYTQNSPSQVGGALIGLGAIQLNGSSDFSEITFDETLLQQIQRQMGQYRFNRNPTFTGREG